MGGIENAKRTLLSSSGAEPTAELTVEGIGAALGLSAPAAQLATALAQSADPQRAPHLACTVLAAAMRADRAGLVAGWARRPDNAARVLAAVCGAAPFLVQVFSRWPAAFLALLDEDFAAPRQRNTYRKRLAQSLGAAVDHGAALRRFKYLELARITVRELSPDLVPPHRAGEILAELSHLADALLACALDAAAARLAESSGPARWSTPDGTPVALGFCVLGLGKLGAEELNYSSDVDLVYVFGNPPGAGEIPLSGGPDGLAPAEYFTRLGREFGRLVSEVTADGFLYRVDLDLRPEGTQGPLVVSSDELANYYELWAATWERAAFAKARPVAGDEVLGWRTIRAIDPMIYRSAMDVAGVAAIREMKEKVEEAKERPGGAYNVKTGAGGIRDVEFVAQALQLLHGGRIPEVRERSTQRALIALAQVGVLPQAACDDLLAAYRFLRRTENRLQMEGERQTHTLPHDAAAQARLARSMGFADTDAFAAALEAHRAHNRSIFAALFSAEGSERILSLFARNVPQLLANTSTRAMLEDLAVQLARAIDASPAPERALNNLDRFIAGVGTRTFYYGLLLDRPELVPRLLNMFASSEYFSSYIATHPRLIESIFSDPNVLLLSRPELAHNLAEIRRELIEEGGRDDPELELDALRLFHNRELINVGLLDLNDRIEPAEAEAALTDIAEVCVAAGLRFAQAELDRRDRELPAVVRAGEFLVVGMGKLASRELTYGSDLDVIFLYDVAGASDADLAEAQEYFVRLAQKFIWTLQTRTAAGVCYAIDARLRPSGNQGMLVSSRAAFARYHEHSAQVWERQAMLRARAVAGGARLGHGFDEVRQAVLGRPLPPDIGRELHRIRQRTESELAHETTHRHDFKTGRGGLQDVETVVQFLQLRHGARHAELFAVARVTAHLDTLARLDLLAPGDAETLRRGWDFLQRLSSRLRIVENRSISDLDEERGDLDAIATRLGYTSPQRAGGARRALLEDYRHHTSAIRAVYLKVLGV